MAFSQVALILYTQPAIGAGWSGIGLFLCPVFQKFDDKSGWVPASLYYCYYRVSFLALSTGSGPVHCVILQYLIPNWLLQINMRFNTLRCFIDTVSSLSKQIQYGA
jgi:hypothetical protein